MTKSKEKTVECVVAHPKFYGKVDGKLKHIAKGTAITVTEERFKKAGKRLVAAGEAQRLEDGTLKTGDKVPAEAMPEQIQQALTDAAQKTAETEKALEAEQTKAKKLAEENKKLKAAAAKASK